MPFATDSARISPDRKKKTLITLYLIGFTTMLGIGIITPVLPLYAQMIGATGFWIGMLFSVFAFSRTIFMPFVGRMSDATGRQRFLLIGLLGYTLFSLLYLAAPDVLSLTVVRFFHGIAAAMVYPIANAYVADMADMGEEGKVMGGFQGAALLGMSFGPLLGGVMVGMFSINGAFLSLSGLAFIAFLLCLVLLPEHHAHLKEIPPLRAVFFSKGMRVPILFFFCYSAAYIAFMVFLPVLAAKGDMDMTFIGILVFIASISMAVSQRLSGRLADTGDRHLVLALGAGIMTISLFLMVISSAFIPMACFSLLLGTGLGISVTAVSALAVIQGRDLGQGSVEGVINTAQGVGIMASPILFGLVMDAAGINVVFLLASGITGFMTLMMAVMVWQSSHSQASR